MKGFSMLTHGIFRSDSSRTLGSGLQRTCSVYSQRCPNIVRPALGRSVCRTEKTGRNSCMSSPLTDHSAVATEDWEQTYEDVSQYLTWEKWLMLSSWRRARVSHQLQVRKFSQEGSNCLFLICCGILKQHEKSTLLFPPYRDSHGSWPWTDAFPAQ